MTTNRHRLHCAYCDRHPGTFHCFRCARHLGKDETHWLLPREIVCSYCRLAEIVAIADRGVIAATGRKAATAHLRRLAVGETTR